MSPGTSACGRRARKVACWRATASLRPAGLCFASQDTKGPDCQTRQSQPPRPPLSTRQELAVQVCCRLSDRMSEMPRVTATLSRMPLQPKVYLDQHQPAVSPRFIPTYNTTSVFVPGYLLLFFNPALGIGRIGARLGQHILRLHCTVDYIARTDDGNRDHELRLHACARLSRQTHDAVIRTRSGGAVWRLAYNISCLRRRATRWPVGGSPLPQVIHEGCSPWDHIRSRVAPVVPFFANLVHLITHVLLKILSRHAPARAT